MLAVGAVGFSTLTLSSSAGASNLTSAKEQAAVLYKQINRINGRVDALGQKYDEAQIKLQRFNNEIANTKASAAILTLRSRVIAS